VCVSNDGRNDHAAYCPDGVIIASARPLPSH
jgi:hypothetical protein